MTELEEAGGTYAENICISDTGAVTYFFSLNLDRGTFALSSGACASGKSEQQKIDTATAMQNKAFRQALMFAWDKQAHNEQSRGPDLAVTNLRNMCTAPELVILSADTADAEGHVFPAGTFYGEMVQYYLEQLGSPIRVDDGVNGWYRPEVARERMAAAREQMDGLVSFPIHIEVVYYETSEANTAQAMNFKESVEGALGADSVVVDLIAAESSNDYYTSTYRISNGAAANYDVFYGSGWGPDYGDPWAYLELFISYRLEAITFFGGSLIEYIGLY